MSDELKLADAPVVEQPAAAAAETIAEVVQPSVVEQQATEQGWVPLEDWKASGRDESEWRPAKEYVDRGELFKSIHTTKRELKQTQAALSALQSHHQYVFEKAHQQALRDLRAEKRLAMREQDMERLEEIETEIETLNDTHAKEKVQFIQSSQAAQAQAIGQPEFQVFVNRNPWYQSDSTLKTEADAIGWVYLQNPANSRDPASLFAHVEREMKRKFPEKFGPTKRAAPSAVAASSKGGHKSGDVDLSESEREVMRTFVRQGVMTEAQYKAELKRVKERS